MWPMLLNMTRDECRLTLRRLELEAYSNMINVFRAQGALEDNRKKLLEELRAVLHISHDRHSAEARRVSNDQLLATIAEQLSGPNTGIAWICEGRRRVPLLPRGIAQTQYTEIADKAAEAAVMENKEIQKRLAAEKVMSSMIKEEEMMDVEGYNQESTLSSSETMDEVAYAPIAMEDQTSKLWETELIARKRKPEGGGTSEDATPPVKNMRNIPANTNQKHLNLSQLYSKFSQPATSKPPSQSKHSYNQVSKVSTSKANTPRSTPHKPRAPKAPKATKSLTKKSKERVVPSQPTTGKQYSASMPLEYAGPPNTFQASYAQAVLGAKSKTDFLDDIKPKAMSSPGIVPESPTMQLLTQPTKLSHEMELSENANPDDHLQPQSAPSQIQTTKTAQIVKNRSDTPDQKMAPKITSDVKIVHKPSDVRLLSNRQMVVTPAQKVHTPGKLVTTKVIGSIPKRASTAPIISEKMIVVSKPTMESRNVPSTKLIVTSSASTPSRERTCANPIPRITETLTPKGIPATDLKVSAKALVLNPKSGQKMVVVPAKGRTKPEGQIPLLHFKGISTAMKLVPVSSQSQMSQVGKSAPVSVVSMPSTKSSAAKIIGMDSSLPIKTANLADIIPAKGMTPVTTPKITNPIVRPSSTKGNVIVVQKGTHLGKALAFAKNGNDMSKIIMGKNVTQLLQASKTEHADASKSAGNVIVLELNNEQSGRPTTMSEILDGRSASAARISSEKKLTPITADTPVLFDNRMTDETCNASSLDSTAESITDMASTTAMMSKDEKSTYKDSDNAKDSSSVTDWEMELDTVVERKDKDDDDKLNSLHLDLGMSSDSEGDYIGGGRNTKSKRTHARRQATGELSEVFGTSSAMSVATRTLLSQLQDEGSSSNDSSFTLKAKSRGLDRETDELTKAKQRLSEKVREARSQQKRIDVYSTAITPSDINLDSFAYLEEGMLAGDDVFAEESKRGRTDALDDQLSRLLGEDSANSNDSQSVSEHLGK